MVCIPAVTVRNTKGVMGNEDMKNTEKAFRWIVGILRKHDMPFQITGGLAARIYGSDRPLADIDIDVPEERIKDISAGVKDYIIWGPDRFVDDNWDLMLMTLKYEDQEIDICSDIVKIRNAGTGKWKETRTDFTQSENHEIYGISVPVVKRDKLIEYKKILNRPVDLEDVEAISK